MTIEQLLADIQARTKGYGIGVASAYLADIEGCLGGEACPTSFGLASPEKWQEAIKAAGQKLVYHDPDMQVLSTKSIDTADEKLGKSLVEFEAIITTNRKDRDGDVMEPKGADFDPAMPLLWQHMAMQPVGKFLGEVKAADNQRAGSFAVYDVGQGLGQDVAILVENKALRISHGFDPKSWEPLKDKDGRWHITKYHTFEASVVSIPSNIDSVITLVSRQKFASTPVQKWAGRYFESRPTVVKSGIEFLANGNVKAPEGKPEENTPAEVPTQKSCGCSAGKDAAKKAFDGMTAVKLYTGPMENSFEWVRNCLHSSLRDFLKCGEGTETKHDYCYIESTFPTFALVEHETWEKGKGYDRKWLKISHGIVDGKPTWIGEAKEVIVQLEISEVQKRMSDRETMRKDYKAPVSTGSEAGSGKPGNTKAGRVLSAKNELTLKETCDLLTKANESISGVLSQLGQPEPEPESDNTEKLFAKAAAIAIAADPANKSLIQRLKKCLQMAEENIEERELLEALV